MIFINISIKTYTAMLRNLLTLALLTLFFIKSNAQPAFYKHFAGNVGDNISLVLDVVVVGEKLKGYYYYYYADRQGDTSWTHFGKSMPIVGHFKADNTFDFSEFKPEVKGAVFAGDIKNGILTGTWTSADGKKKLPFSATEHYPTGTMAFKVFYARSDIPLFEKKATPSAAMELSLLLPDGFPATGIADSVRKNIYLNYFGHSSLDGSPEMLINQAKTRYADNYRKSNEDIYQEGAASFNWSKIKEVNILHNEHDVLSLEFHDYGFTGGAHGLSISKFKVIDLQTGMQVGLDELFVPGYREELEKAINRAARVKYKLAREEGLKKAGFYDDAVSPGENFYLTKDGIGFFYNQYEVAPFALGPVSIFVSFQDLKSILAPGSAAQRLIIAE